jgi:micrococcal nuclease
MRRSPAKPRIHAPLGWRIRRWAPPLLLLYVLACCVRLIWSPSAIPVASEPHLVTRVIDGDTLELDSGHRVRLLGVNTPETKHADRPTERFGPEASEFTRRLVEGHLVRLEFDRERYDDYRRILAYVWLDDRLVNSEIIRAGFSRAEVGFPIRADRKRLFLAEEQAARTNRAGLWSEPSTIGTSAMP